MRQPAATFLVVEPAHVDAPSPERFLYRDVTSFRIRRRSSPWCWCGPQRAGAQAAGPSVSASLAGILCWKSRVRPVASLRLPARGKLCPHWRARQREASGFAKHVRVQQGADPHPGGQEAFPLRARLPWQREHRTALDLSRWAPGGLGRRGLLRGITWLAQFSLQGFVGSTTVEGSAVGTAVCESCANGRTLRAQELRSIGWPGSRPDTSRRSKRSPPAWGASRCSGAASKAGRGW